MTKALSDQEAVARVSRVLKDAFASDVRFELTRESDNVFRVKATSDNDASIADGLEAMKAARLRSAIDGGVAVKMISDDDADKYLSRASATNDPVLAAGYRQLARDARGE